jgi:4-amino-4-deoxy-L-arabinose transferase-like glycosyltransferase
VERRDFTMNLAAPLRAAGRWRDALVDPARRDRTILVSLAIYVVVWTVYGTIAKSSQGLHPDMTEVIAWSRDVSLGQLKHPPFAAFLVRLWFTVLPFAGWSYYLLALLMPATTLWIVWRMSADYLDADKRIVGLALLTFVPFFNFHALKFNVNTVLLPLWAATTWCFLKSVRTPGTVWAILAGVAAAGAMLGKYWSVFLLAGLGLAVLLDKRRSTYFRSAAPWFTIAAGLIALAPHLLWLFQSGFESFSYAMIVHGDKPLFATLIAALGYVAGAFGYVAAPVVVAYAISRPGGKTLYDIVWPADPERRFVAVAFWGPLLLPTIAAVAGGAEITSLWSMPAFSLLPVLLLSSSVVAVRELDTRRVLLGAAALPIFMLVVSPLITIASQRAGPKPAAAQASLLAGEVERLWRQSTTQPLRFIDGDEDLAYGVAVYAADRPRALSGMPAPAASELARSGFVWLCFAEDDVCRGHAVARVGPAAKLVETQFVRIFLRVAGKPQRYAIYIVPPKP